MAQNIYDDPEFLAGYRTLPRSQLGLDGAPEWPTTRDMLPSVSGKRIVDLGCGFGWFSRWAANQQAASVIGVDLSADMLAEARAAPMERITYQRADLETYELSDSAADLVYSSLAFHYVCDFGRLVASIANGLVAGGSLVFSVEHPIFGATTGDGFSTTNDGGSVWPVTGYLDEGERTSNWFAPGVRKQHRTVQGYVTPLLDAGFTLTNLVEWGPSPEQVKANPRWAPERDRPMFLLLAATR